MYLWAWTKDMVISDNDLTVKSVSDEHVLLHVQTIPGIDAIPVPGKMPKIKHYTVMIVPSDGTKSNLWRKYYKACAEETCKAVGLTKEYL